MLGDATSHGARASSEKQSSIEVTRPNWLGKRRCLGTTSFVARSFTNKDVRDQYRGSCLRVVSKLQKPSGDARCKDLKRQKRGWELHLTCDNQNRVADSRIEKGPKP